MATPMCASRAVILDELIGVESSGDSDNSEYELSDLYLLHGLNKRPKPRHRQKGYIQSIALHFHLDEFKTFFRVGRITVQCLQEHINMICSEKNIPGMTAREYPGGSPQKSLGDRILVMLWYMASLDKFASIADRFGMSESTACDAVRKLLSFIQEFLVEKVIFWPSVDEMQEIQSMYLELKNFPGVVGMIDGTHIQVHKPLVRGIDYYNRKDYYSVVLQAVVREDLRFIDVYTGWPGKVHDARVFRNSPLYEKGQSLCETGHILGDSAYPNMPFLLTPFRDNGHLTEVQKRYNQVHSSIRVNVERAFGLLKGRFVRLQNVVQKDIKTIVSTILTGCVLHNLCILTGDDLKDILTDNSEVPQGQPNLYQFDANVQEAGALKRLNIARRL